MQLLSLDDPVTGAILAFLESIGIPVVVGEVPADSFLPGMTVSRGILYLSTTAPGWPGDLLHEAGHIAVSDPRTRATAELVSPEPAEEMAAIAWSYAAALAIGVRPKLVFHEAGYHGGGAWLADNFAEGRYVGVPMLEYWGMTGPATGASYPDMHRWLRD